MSIRTSLEHLGIDAISLPRANTAQQPLLGGKRLHPPRKLKYGVLFGLLGALVGGVIGDLVTQKCACDDPGYGAVFGIPIGAAAGAVTGVILAR